MKVTARVLARIHVRRSLPEPAQRVALRKRSGLTQKELAEILGVDRTAIAHWEAGRRHPEGKRLADYVEALQAFEDAA
ncbi:helix-turn-helix transcriptional regulator [Streptomyces sp. B21-101]|uniref:helix-turn-helix transcriptional regulator n=1 Tax=Streptomyces sp. B21-101 TaxID=3039415 RepID=UPI002FF1C248